MPKSYFQQVSCGAGLLLFPHFSAKGIYEVQTLGTESPTGSIRRNEELYFPLLKGILIFSLLRKDCSF